MRLRPIVSFGPRPASGRRCAAVLAAGLVLAACSNASNGDSSSKTTAAPATSAAAATSTAATATTAAGQGSSAPTTAPVTDTTALNIGTFAPITGVPGVTDKTISFAALGTFGSTSPLGGCQLECFLEGVKAYFAYRNSVGGVQGRQLALQEPVNDEILNGQVKAREILQRNDAFGIFAVPVASGAGWADIAKAGMPLYSLIEHGPDAIGQESSFVGSGNTCISCSRRAYLYPAVKLGLTKVGVLGYNVASSQNFVASINASVKKYGGELGITMAYSNADLGFGLANGVAPEVTAMKQAGVQILFTGMDLGGLKTVKQELARQGMNDVVVVLPASPSSPNFTGDNAKFWDGAVAGSYLAPPGLVAAYPPLATFNEWIAKSTYKNLELDSAAAGWAMARLAVQGILDAGPQFDRAKVVAATNQIKNYTAGGIYTPFNPGHHTPETEDDRAGANDPECEVFAQLKDGSWKLFSNVDKPFQCWDLKNLDKWAAPTDTALA